MEIALKSNYDYSHFTMNKSDPGYVHFLTSDIDKTVLDDNFFATCSRDALLVLKERKNLTLAQLQKCIKTEKISTLSHCTVRKIDCDPKQTKYYLLNGQCNNEVYPLWGSENTPMIRLLPAFFDETINYTSRADSLTVSEKLGTKTRPPGFNNDMTNVALQILAHELMKTKKYQVYSAKRDGGINCVNSDDDPRLAELISMNKYCIPIPVKKNDTCYRGQQKFLNYLKSIKSLDSCNLDLTPAPTNFETSFIDCKLIYSERSLAHLDTNGGKFDDENFKAMHDIIVGYDERSMQLPGLFLFLNYFVKLHNVIFEELKKLKPKLSSEVLASESRKAVCGIFQKIIIDIVVGVLRHKEKLGLFSLGNCYNSTINPAISVEFVMTFRNIHRFIQDDQMVYSKSFFEKTPPIGGKDPDPVSIVTLMDNLTVYNENKCGLTHGGMG